MRIEFRVASYYATDLSPEEHEFDWSGWVRVTTGYRTGNIARAAVHSALAVGEAKRRIDAWIAARQAAIAPSVAVDVDIDIPAPPGLAYRGYQKAGIAFMRARRNSLNADVPRLGKAQPLDAKILTPQGWTTMGALRVGDAVVGADGNTTYVTGVFPQGKIEAFRVVLNDGSSTVCSEEHLWSVHSPASRLRKRPHTVRTLKDITARGLQNRHGKDKWFLPSVVVKGALKDLPVDPYVLGYLLGNGSLSGTTPAVSYHVADEEVIDRIKNNLGPDFVITSRTTSENGKQACLAHRQYKCNPLLDGLRTLRLQCLSDRKHIPETYMSASYDQRLELMRGLLDSDGSCIDNRTVFHSTNALLADGVKRLAWSLGFYATLRAYPRAEKKTYDHDYQVRICSRDVCPFWLQRKARVWHPSVRLNKPRAIRTVEALGLVEQQCISVASSDHLYVTDDYIVTHNTIQSLGVANTYGHRLKILVVGPANAKSNWAREAKRWLVHQGTIGYAEGNDCPATDFLSINYEILGRHIQYLQSVTWDIVVFDEAHYIKNPKSQRGKMCYGFKNEFKGLTGRLHTIWTTGTPIWKSPIDLWPMLQKCDPNGLGNKWFNFVMRYCDAKKNGFGYDTSGASNLEELQFKMRAAFMIRREKHDVMTEIEPTREIVRLPKDGLAKVLKQEKNLVQQNLGTIFELLGEVEQRKADEILAAFNELAANTAGPIAAVRRELALRKCDMVCDFLEELFLTERKVVVWVYHRDVAHAIKERFPTASMVIGGLTTKQRDEQIDRFQTDPDVRLFIGNMDAAGMAISLSAADVDVFAELDYVPSKIDQCEERIWLFDKTNPCTHIKVVVEDSLEERVAELLEMRQEIVRKTISAKALPGSVN